MAEYACMKCKSTRVAHAQGKCSDMSSVNIGDKEHMGYLPSDLGIGDGDYFDFRYCLDCGTIQYVWPLPKTELETDEVDDDEEY